jgi:hypothetical protein
VARVSKSSVSSLMLEAPSTGTKIVFDVMCFAFEARKAGWPPVAGIGYWSW